MILSIVAVSCTKDKKPMACFTAPTIIELYQKGPFTNCSENATIYLWDFGNGHPICTAETPYVTDGIYSSEGQYTVKLTVNTGDENNSSTTSQVINVTNACDKFAGTWTANRTSALLGNKAYTFTIEAFVPLALWFTGLLGSVCPMPGPLTTATIQLASSGSSTSFTIDNPNMYYLQDETCKKWTNYNGTGTLNGNTLTINLNFNDGTTYGSAIITATK